MSPITRCLAAATLALCLCPSTGCDGPPPRSAPAAASSGMQDGTAVTSSTSPPSATSAPSATAMADGPVCMLVVSGTGPYALALKIRNPGPKPLALRYFHPISFALEAQVAGKRIEVEVPALDIPVEPRVLEVPAGETAELGTPITIQFASPTSTLDSSRPFTWQLLHEPADVALRALRAFDSDPALVCTGTLTKP